MTLRGSKGVLGGERNPLREMSTGARDERAVELRSQPLHVIYACTHFKLYFSARRTSSYPIATMTLFLVISCREGNENLLLRSKIFLEY